MASTTPGLRSCLLFLLPALVWPACSGGGGGGSPGAGGDPGLSTVTIPRTWGIPSDGVAAATIEVTLRDAAGQPIAGRPVSVSVTGAENMLLPGPTTPSSSDGTAEFRLVTTQAGRRSLTVTADLGRPTVIATDLAVEFVRALVARARVSVSSSGEEANDFNGHAAVSGNGRWVAFVSKASNLVPGDTNQKEDVFVHDRETRMTERVNLTPSGGQFPDLSGQPSVSDDGSLVAFQGRLADDDAIWVRNRLAGITQPISDATGLSGRSFEPEISGDGRWVAFVNNNGEQQQVYAFDRMTTDLVLISKSSTGEPANDPSHAPSISRDGRWVVFASTADNLVAGDSNEKIDVFLRDRQTGLTTLVSRNAAGGLGNDDSIEANIAADGRWVAFMSKAENLVPGDDNGKSDVFVVDTRIGAIQRVSVKPDGSEVDKESWLPDLNADGSFVAFSSLSDDIVAGDTNGKEDIFRRNLVTGVTIRVSLGLGGNEPNELSTAPALAADAPVVAYESKASNLVPGDGNDKVDVFMAPRD